MRSSSVKRTVRQCVASGLALAAVLTACQSRVSQGEPAWVLAPDSVYNPNQYLAAVGYGRDRASAEKGAIAALTGLFGQSVEAEINLETQASEKTVNNRPGLSSESTALSTAIKTTAELDSLVGAEIANVWYDRKTTYYAVAVMEKAKATVLYTQKIRENQRLIDGLTNLSGDKKNTLDGYSRYQRAAAIADENRIYGNILTVIGSPVSALSKGNDYRLEAVNIAQNIPIGVIVTGDRENRITGAFSSALSQAGFRSGGNNSRYVLEVTVSLSSVEYPNQANKFFRYEISANLMDTAEDTVLLPFSSNGREGHPDSSEAKNRAVAAAEKKIASVFGQALGEYLSSP
ncbi:MAG: LPP20 family lipoprotein [Treponema sp.]|jgi:hypothetical protein|nr:LPP20 family lipoprotein [Treponema sp.]